MAQHEQATSKIEVCNFECDALSQYTDSMLFDSGKVIATGVFSKGERKVKIDLKICGDVSVYFDGEHYRYPSYFPDELRELFKLHKADDDERVEIYYNNWFEYVFYDEDDYFDGQVCERDLAKSTAKDILDDMLYYASDFV